jgi:PncC family amidohydrolase
MVQETAIESHLETISSYLVSAGETLAVAESVTAGALQSRLAAAKAAMQFFQGGLTAYNITQKVKHLGVDPIHAMSCNCVSAIVAAEMSGNVTRLFNCEWGIGVTGYASPVPEKDIHERFACVSISRGEEEMLSEVLHARPADPVLVREFYTAEILARFAGVLKKRG